MERFDAKGLDQEAITQRMLGGLTLQGAPEVGRLSSLTLDRKLWGWLRSEAARRRALGLPARSHDLILEGARCDYQDAGALSQSLAITRLRIQRYGIAKMAFRFDRSWEEQVAAEVEALNAKGGRASVITVLSVRMLAWAISQGFEP